MTQAAFGAIGADGRIMSPPVRLALTVSELRRAAWTCSLGSALEYYDFALYSLASALVFGPLFFPSATPVTSLIASFATYFVGFAVRPIGGIVFGRLGDHIGRKKVLLMTITLMGLASTGIGLIPTYQTIGIWAPILLITARMLQGLGAGAEQAGAAVMMTEYAPVGQRGFYASLPFLGIQIGTIIAAVVYCSLLFGVADITHSWIWRLPFLVSAVILVVALYMRLKLRESPTFEMIQRKVAEERESLFSLIQGSWRTILAGIGVRMAENGGSSIYQVLAISYLVNTMGLGGLLGTTSLITAAVIGGFTVPIAGRLSDRFGRIRIYRTFAILQAITALPVWYAFSTGRPLPAIIALSIALGVTTWGMFGTQAAMLPEMFGARHRYMAVSLAREVSAVIAGGITPLIGSCIIRWVASFSPFAAHPGQMSWLPIAGYVIFLAGITIGTTYFIPECRNRDLVEQNDIL
ncbi:MFS transporter [Komagataeibacter oboediens]|uniref:MFS transporter n=1 Tax=Komagataeibacter oboediens TaxID=65958 RepID=A0A318R1R7_9PROT|nr:MFS transporter [Komagataeibacter oboediens]PYD79583.1 MFS transporter [Komagataeibacter oboediens]